MSRRVSGPKPGETTPFVPDVEIGEWRNLDDAETPVTAHITNPSKSDVRAWLRDNRSTHFEFDDNGDTRSMTTKTDAEAWKYNALKRFVKKIDNYELNGIDIVNGELLWRHGDTEILDAVALRVRSALTLEKKQPTNSSKPSGSPVAETEPSSGTATNAA